MNIVYKFTSSATGKFYIGSKTECEVINGKIVDRNGKNYYSSSTDDDFWCDLQQNGMILEILEEVPNRDILLDRETYHQEVHDAIKSEMCYNKILANRIRNSITPERMGSVVNPYGETLNEVTVNNSALKRKDTKAIRMGFTNYGEMYKQVLKIKATGKSLKYLDDLYGLTGFFKRALKGKDLKDFDEPTDIIKVATLLQDGATFVKACELCGYKDWVVRERFGDSLVTVFTRRHRIATANGFETEQDLNNFIMTEYINGKDSTLIATNLDGVSKTTVRRIIDKLCRKRLDINDFK